MVEEVSWVDFGTKPIEDDEIAIDKRDFIDEDGNDIFLKKSFDKTVEERIKTSRTLKIKNNRWNQVDYTEEYTPDKITIEPGSCQYNSTFEDIEFEQKFYDTIENSKYKELLLSGEKKQINYQVVNDIIVYCYSQLKPEYTLARIFVIVCEYCGVGLNAMWKRLSAYLQTQILEDLSEVSKLPKELLNNGIKLF